MIVLKIKVFSYTRRMVLNGYMDLKKKGYSSLVFKTLSDTSLLTQLIIINLNIPLRSTLILFVCSL